MMARAKTMAWFFVLSAVAGAGAAPALAGDNSAQKKVSQPGRYSGYSQPIYQDMITRSVYVPMRDGVRLAVSYSLPKGLPPSERIPALLLQTRYWRAMAIKSMNDVSVDRYFTAYGYAAVKVDVRGTGASFGTWPYPWSPDEVKDGAEIVDWIVRQPWSNGRVGTFGNSYVGATAEFLLVNKHPAVKAAVVRYSLIDSYADIVFPGGIFDDWFIKTWNTMNQALDANDTGTLMKMMGMFPFRLPGIPGVKPVDQGRKGRKELKAAIAEHKNNGDVYAEARRHEFRDDYADSWKGRIEQISPYFYKQDIEGSGAAIYSYSGWYDGSYTAPSTYRYLTVSNCKKLIIGPWPHGGRENISPWRETRLNTFDHYAELLRFFDYYLKGIDNGIKDEPAVWYYTLGEEKWKSASTWPPQSTTTTYYLAEGLSLSLDAPKNEDTHDVYRVDYTAGTGNQARLNSLVNLKSVPIGYPDRAVADKKLLVYETAPLAEAIEVTGHPVVRLFVSSTAADGQFFVYLEDVAPDGKVSYLTEGLLRAACRKVSNEKPPYQMAPGVPYHTFKRVDAEPLVPGEVALITFDLQPTSVLFRQGHRIRVAVAGADKDHYTLTPGPAPELKVFRSALYPSAIDLPVIWDRHLSVTPGPSLDINISGLYCYETPCIEDLEGVGLDMGVNIGPFSASFGRGIGVSKCFSWGVSFNPEEISEQLSNKKTFFLQGCHLETLSEP